MDQLINLILLVAAGIVTVVALLVAINLLLPKSSGKSPKELGEVTWPFHSVRAGELPVLWSDFYAGYLAFRAVREYYRWDFCFPGKFDWTWNHCVGCVRPCSFRQLVGGAYW